MYNRNLKAYTRSSMEAELAVADPYRVIQLMMQGCIERLAQSKGAVERKDFEGKSIAITKCMALINGLQDALDLSYGKVPEDLFALYEYMKLRLQDASSLMDTAPLDEVAQLMLTIKGGWDGIPLEERAIAFAHRQAGKAE